MRPPKRYFCATCWRSFIPPRARVLLGVLGALTLVALGIGSAVLANSGEQELTVVTRRVQVVRTTTGPVEMVTLAPKRVTVKETTLSGTTKTLPGRTVTVQRAGRTVVVRRRGRTVTVSAPERVRRRVVLKPVVEVREKRVVVTTPGRTMTTPRVTVTQPPQTSTETRTVNVDRPVTVTTDRPVTQTVTVNRPVTSTVTQTQTATQTVTETQTATQTVTNTVTVTVPPPPRKP